MPRLLLLAVLSTLMLLSPSAAAEPACASSVCAGTEEGAWGDERCDAGSGGSYQSVFASYADDESQTGAFVSRSCWNDGEDGAESLSVAVTRLEWATFDMQGVVVVWEQGRAPGASWCVITVHVHAPGAGTLVPAPCPAEQGPPRPPAPLP